MIVNFFDRNISYAASFDDALEKGRCKNHVTYSKQYERGNVNVFTDTHISDVINHQNDVNVAWVMEPRSYIRDVYAWLSSNHKLFDAVMTHDFELIESISNGVYLPAMCTMIDSDSIQASHSKSMLCSLIYSDKKQLPGHKLRFSCADKIRSNNLDVSLCGSGTGVFMDKKSDGLNDFMFSITIENSKSRGYFTEKILDCFSTQTIPIYWGDSHVWEYFDAEGAILFNSVEELPEIIAGLSVEKYNSLLSAAKRNWEICRKEYYSMDRLVAKTINRILDV